MALRAAAGEIQCVLANVMFAFFFSTTNYHHTEVFCQGILKNITNSLISPPLQISLYLLWL